MAEGQDILATIFARKELYSSIRPLYENVRANVNNMYPLESQDRQHLRAATTIKEYCTEFDFFLEWKGISHTGDAKNIVELFIKVVNDAMDRAQLETFSGLRWGPRAIRGYPDSPGAHPYDRPISRTSFPRTMTGLQSVGDCSNQPRNDPPTALSPIPSVNPPILALFNRNAAGISTEISSPTAGLSFYQSSGSVGAVATSPGPAIQSAVRNFISGPTAVHLPNLQVQQNAVPFLQVPVVIVRPAVRPTALDPQTSGGKYWTATFVANAILRAVYDGRYPDWVNDIVKSHRPVPGNLVRQLKTQTQLENDIKRLVAKSTDAREIRRWARNYRP
jgi:hypothetical protein